MAAAYIAYAPVKFFGWLSVGFGLPAVVLGGRYAALMTQGAGKGHVQSVIVAAALGACAVFMLTIGAVAHLLSVNRRLLEEIRYLNRRRMSDSAPTLTVRAVTPGAMVRPAVRPPDPH